MSIEETQKAAREFAWKHFDFHAKQRIEVFKSYLTLLAFIFAGYGVAVQTSNFSLGALLAFYSICLAILFWRWDRRSCDLIKTSETYLLKDEAQLAAVVGPEVRLFAESDRLSDESAKTGRRLSYTQILRDFFIIGGLVHGLILLFFVYKLVCSMITPT